MFFRWATKMANQAMKVDYSGEDPCSNSTLMLLA